MISGDKFEQKCVAIIPDQSKNNHLSPNSSSGLTTPLNQIGLKIVNNESNSINNSNTSSNGNISNDLSQYSLPAAKKVRLMESFEIPFPEISLYPSSHINPVLEDGAIHFAKKNLLSPYVPDLYSTGV